MGTQKKCGVRGGGGGTVFISEGGDFALGKKGKEKFSFNVHGIKKFFSFLRKRNSWNYSIILWIEGPGGYLHYNTK